MAQLRRTSRTLPGRNRSSASSDLTGHPKQATLSPLVSPRKSSSRAAGGRANGKASTPHPAMKPNFINAPLYLRMQGVVQQMLHSENGVPIKSHKRRLISAIPSAFTGSDMVNWLSKNLSISTKAEAIHLANLICCHGYFFCIEGVGTTVKDDGTLFRFQTPYYWPSQSPDISDHAYGVYLVKQVLRSKHRIRLLDYELNNLHKLKLRLAKDWKTITEKAEDDVRVFREQKRVARAIMSSQEEAFWRLYRPPPGESSVQDSALTRYGTELLPKNDKPVTAEELIREMDYLKLQLSLPKSKVSTSVRNIISNCYKYADFDSMMTLPTPANPWQSGDTTSWDLDMSLVEQPTERHVKKWACDFHDLLNDVTGRYKFEQYCKSQFNLENIRFFQACRDLKSIPFSAVTGSVQLIYDEFLQRGAASEVNISAAVQQEIENDLTDPSRYAFNDAVEQIYKLMQNDIYPRFLKSKEYQEMLRKGKEVEDSGKGFFAKLQKKKIDFVKQDATGISPCLPQRFTKRNLSISRKLSMTGCTSSSLDNIFTAAAADSPFGVETKRTSAYTEAFIDSLTAPDPSKMAGIGAPFRQRRVSAPDTPVKKKQASLGSPDMTDITEASQQQQLFPPFDAPLSTASPGMLAVDGGMPMSYSADDMQQLMDDADALGPSKWKKFGIAAGIELCEPLTTNILTPSLAKPDPLMMQISASPAGGGHGAFEMESLEVTGSGRTKLSASSESVHSTSSH